MLIDNSKSTFTLKDAKVNIISLAKIQEIEKIVHIFTKGSLDSGEYYTDIQRSLWDNRLIEIENRAFELGIDLDSAYRDIISEGPYSEGCIEDRECYTVYVPKKLNIDIMAKVSLRKIPIVVLHNNIKTSPNGLNSVQQGTMSFLDPITGEIISQFPRPIVNYLFGPDLNMCGAFDSDGYFYFMSVNTDGAQDWFKLSPTSDFYNGWFTDDITVLDYPEQEECVCIENPNVQTSYNYEYNTTTGDYFGNTVAMSDSRIISGTNGTIVYIHSASSTTRISTIEAPKDSRAFGRSVDISNRYAIVGAAGAAYVYSAGGGSGTKLYNPNKADLSFGQSVGMSDYLTIVGAPNNELACLYTPSGSLLKTLRNPYSRERSAFGESVAASDKYVIVGTCYHYPYNQAYVYDMNGILVSTLSMQGVNSDAEFSQDGIEVAISNKYAVVGGNGVARIFLNSSGKLLHTIFPPVENENTPAYNYLLRVGIHDNLVVIGLPGVAYIFSIRTGKLVYTLNDPNGPAVYDEEGQFMQCPTGFASLGGVAMNKNYAIIGAPGVYGVPLNPGQLIFSS